MTLVEVVIATALLGIVIVIFTVLLSSVQRGLDRANDRSQSNDQVQAAVAVVSRDVRMAQRITLPTVDGMTMRLMVPSAGASRCVEWRLSAQQLERRVWDPTWATGGAVEAWRVVADHVVNAAAPSPDPATVPLFVLDTSGSYRTGVLLQLTVLTRFRASQGRAVRTATSIAGRNAPAVPPADACTTPPP